MSNPFDLDHEETETQEARQLPSIISSQVEFYQQEERRIAGKITLISLQLRPGATDAQQMLNDVQDHVADLTAFVGQQSLLLEAALTMQKQFEQEIVRLEAEKDDAMQNAQDGYDTGYTVGYDEAIDDMAGKLGDGVESGTEFTRAGIEYIDLTDRLNASEERVQELEAEIVQAQQGAAAAEQMATELQAAYATIAKWNEWYAENVPQEQAG
jgi:hypothetical protein